MDYLGGGDLRYHLMNKTKFDEDATSRYWLRQGLLYCAWRKGCSISTPAALSITMSNPKISFFRTKGTADSLIWE